LVETPDNPQNDSGNNDDDGAHQDRLFLHHFFFCGHHSFWQTLLPNFSEYLQMPEAQWALS